ncbi:sensor histidine kinase [Thermocatellispora tengchongensis]|uniref:sensor histidine kinase n=1 Tax=Thermocatellispora tengchongensis TaxID=1073253 RepID=UPI003632CC8F
MAHRNGTIAYFAPQSVLDDYRAGVLSDLLLRCSAVLVGAIGVAALAGRMIAGRTLARLHRITETARELSERDLNRRLALEGPQDELKELGDTFDGMLARLQAAFDSQRRFAANASHELRTPLAIQRAAVEVPLATGRVPAHLVPAMRRVLDACRRSERLIDGLLLLASGERGPVEKQPVDLARVARRAARTVAADGREDLEVRLELRPAVVEGDPVLLEHLVRNVLDNAVRYNVPGGTAEVTARPAAGGAEIVVTNTGPVVPEEQAARLFVPFHRGNGQRLSGDGGSGLGLSIVRAIAGAHGGTAAAVPRPEGGLTVTIFLPGPAVSRPHRGDPSWAARTRGASTSEGPYQVR